jgi:hypothetical protein
MPGDDADEVRWVSSRELKNLDVNPRNLKSLGLAIGNDNVS